MTQWPATAEDLLHAGTPLPLWVSFVRFGVVEGSAVLRVPLLAPYKAWMQVATCYELALNHASMHEAVLQLEGGCEEYWLV